MPKYIQCGAFIDGRCPGVDEVTVGQLGGKVMVCYHSLYHKSKDADALGNCTLDVCGTHEHTRCRHQHLPQGMTAKKANQAMILRQMVERGAVPWDREEAERDE